MTIKRYTIASCAGLLTSLSLDCLPHPQTIQQVDLFSLITLTHLKTISFRLYGTDDLSVLNQLLSLLRFLEDLQLSLRCMSTGHLGLSSQTVKKLKLTFFYGYPQLVTLSFPSLELLHWDNHGKYIYFPQFRGEIPLLRKAVISLAELDGHKHDIAGAASLLTYISHVEDLILHVNESQDKKYPIPISSGAKVTPNFFNLKILEKYPTHVSSEAAKVAPNFPNLKSLNASLCCHEHSIRAIVTILAKSPALESLKLVHEVPKLHDSGKKKSGWESKLVHHTDGICHQNLHLGEKKKELMDFPMRL